MSETDPRLRREIPVISTWQGNIHDPSTGHDLSIDVSDFADGSSLVRVVNPILGTADAPTGEDQARSGIIEGEHFIEIIGKNGEGTRRFAKGVCAIARGEQMPGVVIFSSNEV